VQRNGRGWLENRTYTTLLANYRNGSRSAGAAAGVLRAESAGGDPELFLGVAAACSRPTRPYRSGRGANAYRRAGLQLGTFDALLAQLCNRNNLTMLTTDEDFSRIAQRFPLKVWSD
jgi:predicted nucleic acid-binding protein